MDTIFARHFTAEHLVLVLLVPMDTIFALLHTARN